MGCGESVLIDGFWQDWMDRFEDEYHTFITPDNPVVERECKKIKVSLLASRRDKARAVWKHVFNTIDYQLSLIWYTPEQTIKNGIGDCEDVTFLISSMLLQKGVEGHHMVIGNLTFPDGLVEEHTWVEVDGLVVDGTGPEHVVSELCYTPAYRWEIRS